jgi:hypothetical protein
MAEERKRAASGERKRAASASELAQPARRAASAQSTGGYSAASALCAGGYSAASAPTGGARVKHFVNHATLGFHAQV